MFQEQYYDVETKTGFLETRLKTLRRKLPLDKKAYKKCEKRKLYDEVSSVSTSSTDTEGSTETVDIRACPEMAEVKEKVGYM